MPRRRKPKPIPPKVGDVVNVEDCHRGYRPILIEIKDGRGVVESLSGRKSFLFRKLKQPERLKAKQPREFTGQYD